MTVSDSQIDEWIEIIASIGGMEMDPNDLAEDTIIVAEVCDDDNQFKTAMGAVYRALNQLVKHQVSASHLERNLATWKSYHFQSERTQGHPADMRICFMEVESGPESKASTIRVRAFGFRHIPADFYKRIYNRPAD